MARLRIFVRVVYVYTVQEPDSGTERVYTYEQQGGAGNNTRYGYVPAHIKLEVRAALFDLGPFKDVRSGRWTSLRNCVDAWTGATTSLLWNVRRSASHLLRRLRNVSHIFDYAITGGLRYVWKQARGKGNHELAFANYRRV